VEGELQQFAGRDALLGRNTSRNSKGKESFFGDATSLPVISHRLFTGAFPEIDTFKYEKEPSRA
jgi:hypothetical protein